MCGIFGASLDPRIMSPERANTALAKIKILGLYNQARGKDSCGFFADNAIAKGVDKKKLWCDFIATTYLQNPIKSKNFVYIGHARSSTIGTHIATNAHPFLIDNDFVLAHNGVIHNIRTLTFDHKMKDDYVVDSNGLAYLIAREGFGILNEYRGHAAIAMTKISEPNSLYIYHGASKDKADGPEIEERPLFTLQTEEGIYFSSIEESLLAISDKETETIKTVEHNIVHKITNGRMTKSKFQVNRGESNVISIPNYSTSTKCQTSGTNCHVARQIEPSVPIPLIWYENMPERAARYKDGQQGIFFHRGRYWIIDSATGDITMAHGPKYVSKSGIVDPTLVHVPNEWFYHGTLMKSLKAYEELDKCKEIKDNWSCKARILSKYSEYPVVNTKSEINGMYNTVPDSKYKFWKNELVMRSDSFTPKWAEISYIIKEGILTEAVHQFDVEKNVEILDRSAYLKDNPIINPNAPHKNFQGGMGGAGAVIKTLISVRKEESEDEHMYLNYDSVLEFQLHMTKLELDALRFYVADLCIMEMDLDVYSIHQEIVSQGVDTYLDCCVKLNESIYERWDEQHYHPISYYINKAKNSPDGMIKDSANDEDSPKENEYFMDHANEQANIPFEKGVVDAIAEVVSVEDNPDYMHIVDIISELQTTRDHAADLNGTDDDPVGDQPFYDEVAYLVYNTVDPFLKNLMELCAKHGKRDLLTYVKARQTQIVGIL